MSVVVPTFDRAALLTDWVTAVLADPDLYEVVAVVDGSQDGSLERLAAVASGDARLVPVWIPNSGQFPALQAGAEKATGDVLLFLDDDVVPPPGLAAAHARHHDGDRKLVVLGYMPVQLGPRAPGNVASYVYSRQYEAQCEEYERDPTRLLECFWAGNFSLRREHALEVGLALPGDEGLFPYHPDREFGLRCRAAGFGAVFDRSLRAEHRHTRAVGAIVGEAQNRARGAVNLRRRHEPALGAWTPASYGEGLRPPLRLLVRAARHAPLAAALVPLLLGLVRATGAARRFRAQEALTVVLIAVVEVRTGVSLTAGATRSRPRRAASGLFRRGLDLTAATPARGLLAWPAVIRLQEVVQPAMPAAEVVRVLDALDRAGVVGVVSGGWGVDALAGRQRRAHLDLDLAVDASEGGDELAVAALEGLGYRVVDAYTEHAAGLPERVILHGDGDRQIDLHPFTGLGHFAAVTDEPFAAGHIGGRSVTCLSVAAQLRYHDGYAPRPVDHLDVAELRRVVDQARPSGLR